VINFSGRGCGVRASGSGGGQVYIHSAVCVYTVYITRRVATSGSSFLLAFPSVEMGYVIIETQHRVPGASKSHVRMYYLYIHTYTRSRVVPPSRIVKNV